MSVTWSYTVGEGTVRAAVVSAEVDLLPAGIPSAVVLAHFPSLAVRSVVRLVQLVDRASRDTGMRHKGAELLARHVGWREVHPKGWRLAGPFSRYDLALGELGKVVSLAALGRSYVCVDPRRDVEVGHMVLDAPRVHAPDDDGRVEVRCGVCHGIGRTHDGIRSRECDRCDGQGAVTIEARSAA